MVDHSERKEFNERFLRRFKKRRPEDGRRYEDALRASVETAGSLSSESSERNRSMALETIVSRERPVLLVQNDAFNTTEVPVLGNEAAELVRMMADDGSKLRSALPFIGRFDVKNFPGAEFLGTGWFVDTEIVVTNRHVASLIATNEAGRFVFRRGIGGRAIESIFCNNHEFDDLQPEESRCFAVKEVLYIEPDSGPNDIAFVRVVRRTQGVARPYIDVAPENVADDVPLCVVGYPARASRRVIPDQELMEELYRGRYDVKRAAPGFSMGTRNGLTEHDCTTLGGNSGSVVLNFDGLAVGLHFAGLYQEANYAVPASILNQYISRKRWNQPLVIERTSGARPAAAPNPSPGRMTTSPSVQIAAPAGQSSITININISPADPTIPVATCGMSTTPRSPDPAAAERAVRDFWDARPSGVIGARVGYLDEGDTIGDVPCIAAAVRPADLALVESTGPREFQGVAVRYEPANIDEQLQSLPSFESVDSIAYDNDARRGEGFSLEPIEEEMDLTLHVGPEYSWDLLKGFLNGDGEPEASKKGRLVSAMYEFHAKHIKDALEKRLASGGSLSLVLDNATFSGRPGEGDFDREPTFQEWETRFGELFDRIVAPEGLSGLISDAYHIKVTVRKDNTFWLSSGNWKAGSSQPIITQSQRDHAEEVDLPGNREWHVIARSKLLAESFRNHIVQDFNRSRFLRGQEAPEAEIFVDVAIEEGVELERRPPSRLLEPKKLTSRRVKVQPLLTPDKEGAVYSKAVLRLIRSARHSLLFQIPYIGMPSNPKLRRGFIDDLIDALTEKLTTLQDARVILRSGSSKYSSPTHAAWFFKSKGVDIDRCLRVIDNHHTKGMIVDGKRVLIGSHNWSKPGVSLNRDASLLFDDAEVAEYYAEAFEIDWERSNPIKPRKYVKPESESVLEAVDSAPPPGYRRMRLVDLMKED